MAVPTVNVTCTAHDQNGNPVAGALFVARLDRTEIYDGFVVPEQFTGVANADGVCVLQLWPNALGVAGSKYKISAVNPETGARFLNELATIPDSDCNLHSVLSVEPYPPINASIQALNAAQAALAQVEAASALAAVYRDQAQSSAEVADGHVFAASASASEAQAAASSANTSSGNATVSASTSTVAASSASSSASAAGISAAAALASETSAAIDATAASASAAAALESATEANAVAAIATEVASRIGDAPTVHLAVTDPHGFAVAVIREDEVSTGSFSVGKTGLFMQDGQTVEEYGQAALAVVDIHGFVGYAVTNEGALLEPDAAGDAPSSLTDAEVNKLNATALISSANARASYNTEVARPVWDYNQFVFYGQSLSIGQEGWPALSKTARLGNVMLGNATRPSTSNTAEWLSVGGSDVFQPLVATVQSAGVVLSDAAVAALTPGDGALGEESAVGMVNFAKLQHNQRWQVANDTARLFLVTSCGVGGRTVEALSKGASPELYLRLTQSVSKAHAVADADSKTHGVVAVAYLQGEANYAGDGDTTLAGYKAALATLRDDIADDVASITGQTAPPLFLTYQTSGTYTNDTNGLAIGMAQWELSKENRNWVMVTPSYPFTDKGGHLDPNGYRWMGAQFGKVWHRVVELGEDWSPLAPLQANLRDQEIHISFHVPVPPLRFAQPYVILAPTDFATKGFSVIDGSGAVVITAVDIVADCVVRLRLARATTGTVTVRYAAKSGVNGNGCLQDSDPTVAGDLYEYSAGTGQYAGANIPALVGQPYPLNNWCIAFNITAVEA